MSDNVNTNNEKSKSKGKRGRKSVPWRGVFFESMNEAMNWLNSNNINSEKLDIREVTVSTSGKPGKPPKGASKKIFKIVLKYNMNENNNTTVTSSMETVTSDIVVENMVEEKKIDVDCSEEFFNSMESELELATAN
jgi:hypothetical protein